jgi:ParB family transcriptional regulator, chromosome partitioning protein
MSKQRLGKGLSALLPTLPQGEEAGRGELLELSLDWISLNPRQPRQQLDQESLAELAASVREHGILQPIIVQRQGQGRYSLVAGERRFRAARMAGRETIPALVRELTEAEVMEIALIENLQREDLNPVEEATAYRQLIEEFGFTQEQLARRIGKSRPTVANMMRLLQLPEKVLAALSAGHLSMGHARALLSLREEKKIKRAADQVMEKGLSVRSTEELVQQLLASPRPEERQKDKPAGFKNDPFTEDLQEQLRHHLGCQVKIKKQGRGGRLEITYYSQEELERLVDLILEDSQRY